jgi:hypothetical protein
MGIRAFPDLQAKLEASMYSTMMQEELHSHLFETGCHSAGALKTQGCLFPTLSLDNALPLAQQALSPSAMDISKWKS